MAAIMESDTVPRRIVMEVVMIVCMVSVRSMAFVHHALISAVEYVQYNII